MLALSFFLPSFLDLISAIVVIVLDIALENKGCHLLSIAQQANLYHRAVLTRVHCLLKVVQSLQFKYLRGFSFGQIIVLAVCWLDGL